MLVILVGTIASGKSTYAKEKAQEGFLVLNDDSIVTMLHGGNYNLYEKKLKPIYKSIENSIVSSVLSAGRDIIIDRGVNITRKSRKRWIGIASAFDVESHAIVFPFKELEVHVEQRMKDPRGLSYEEWMEAVRRHIKEYEVPFVEEGFKKVKWI